MYCIIGANGYLGAYLRKAILEDTNEDILCADLNIPEEKQERVTWRRCDITDRDAVDRLIDHLRTLPDLKILYLAAYHNPDGGTE